MPALLTTVIGYTVLTNCTMISPICQRDLHLDIQTILIRDNYCLPQKRKNLIEVLSPKFWFRHQPEDGPEGDVPEGKRDPPGTQDALPHGLRKLPHVQDPGDSTEQGETSDTGLRELNAVEGHVRGPGHMDVEDHIRSPPDGLLASIPAPNNVVPVLPDGLRHAPLSEMAGVARKRQGKLVFESKENSPLWTRIMGKVPMVALLTLVGCMAVISYGQKEVDSEALLNPHTERETS